MAETMIGNIAIIDDDALLREGLKDCMDSAGYSVETFGSAEEFLASQPLALSCLVLDIQLPGISGLELQRRLVSIGNHAAIVFVTAHGTEANRQQALENGAVALLSKPVRRQELLNAVKSALEH